VRPDSEALELPLKRHLGVAKPASLPRRPPRAGRAPEPLTLKPKLFAELQALPSEPDWLWQGFLAPGSLTMLAGHPFAGKSMLVSGLLRALETGEPFLERTTKAASALLVTEEDQSSLRERAGRFNLFGIRSEYLDRSSSVGHDWSALIAGAAEWALAREHRLLVIDTFPGLAGLGDEQENDAGAITSRLQPLQVAAGAGLAVLFLHHMNNANQPRGSKAFRGVVDTSIRFLRKTKSNSFRLESETRSTTSTSRSLRAELVQSHYGWFYRSLDASDANSASTRSVDDRLWQVLLEAGEQGITYAELDGREGLTVDVAKKRLPRWKTEKRIGRAGAGTKSDPYKWYPLPQHLIRCGAGVPKGGDGTESLVSN
jgi:AAA domain